MDFDPVCVDDCRTVVHRAGDRGGERSRRARQLGDRGCDRTRLLERMGGVHTACGCSGQTVPVDGPEVCISYSDHTVTSFMMAPLGSVTAYFLSRGLLELLFRMTDPGALRLLSTFTVSVLSMSFTGILTYWLVVGLYQSVHFYQAAMERQTIAAQLETQLFHD